jgi:hypothetical protein
MNNKKCVQKYKKIGKNNVQNAQVLFHKFITIDALIIYNNELSF